VRREERKRERERERRLDARDAHGVKKSKLTRDRERDISERIALGQARAAPPARPAPDACCNKGRVEGIL